MDPIRVGRLSLQPVLDGIGVLEPSMFVTAHGPTDWSAHADLLDAHGRLILPIGVFVVRVRDARGERVVMLDAGVGETDDPMFDGHALLDNLAAAGLAPGDIDTILVTHCHADHCGWLERDGAATFPNATVWIGAADWTFFVEEAQGGRRRARRLRAIEEHVQLIDRDGLSVAPGITTRATPGHTPGHTSVVLSDGHERLVMLGDALHCPAQLTESEWQFMYDVDADLASRTRESLLREAESPSTALLPAHFPGMVAARLLPATGRRHWVLGAGYDGLTG